MSSDPPIPAPGPALSRRRWEALPLVRSHIAAFAAGYRPGEYRTRGDSYEHYLARSGSQAEQTAEPVVVVEEAPGVTLRLEIERLHTTATRTSSPADLRYRAGAVAAHHARGGAAGVRREHRRRRDPVASSACAVASSPPARPTRSPSTSAPRSTARRSARTSTWRPPTTSTPSSPVPTARRALEVFHWGLIPVWAKERKIGAKMINARAETLAEKPAFKGVFKKTPLHHPDGRLLRVEGGRARRTADQGRQAGQAAACSSTASTASRWPSPGCGRRGATRPPGPTPLAAQRHRSSPRRPTTRWRRCTTGCR